MGRFEIVPILAASSTILARMKPNRAIFECRFWWQQFWQHTDVFVLLNLRSAGASAEFSGAAMIAAIAGSVLLLLSLIESGSARVE